MLNGRITEYLFLLAGTRTGRHLITDALWELWCGELGDLTIRDGLFVPRTIFHTILLASETRVARSGKNAPIGLLLAAVGAVKFGFAALLCYFLGYFLN